MSGPWEDYAKPKKAAPKSEKAAPKSEAMPWEDFKQPSSVHGQELEGAKNLPSVLEGIGNLADFASSPFREAFDRGTEDIPENPVTIENPVLNNPAIALGEMGDKLTDLPFQFDYSKAYGGFKDQLNKNISRPFSAPAEAAPFSRGVTRIMNQSSFGGIKESAKGIAPHVIGLGMDVLSPAPETLLAATPLVSGKIKKTIGELKGAVRSQEEAQLAKALDKYTTKSQFINSGFDTSLIAPRLVEEDLSKYATNPDKMLEALDGRQSHNLVELIPGSGVKKGDTTKAKGMIANINDDMRGRIKELQEAQGVEVKLPAVALSQKLKARQELMVRGRNSDASDVEASHAIIDNILKPFQKVNVPGLPMEVAIENGKRFAGDVPPVVPLGPPDVFPGIKQESLVKAPEFPNRPGFEGIEFPQLTRAQEDMNRMNLPDTTGGMGIARKYPARPVEPQSYGGIVNKNVSDKYQSDLSAWEKEVKRLDRDYDAQVASADSQVSDKISAAERTRESLANDAIAKYDSAVAAWEDEVSKLKNEYRENLSSARNYDAKVEQVKVENAAKRFIEKAKRNEAYAKEVNLNDRKFYEKVVEDLKAASVDEPVSVSLTDLMEMRSYIGRQMDSKDFITDKNLAREKEIYEQIYHGLKDEIKDKLSGRTIKVGKHNVPADGYYEAQSDRMRRLIQAKNILEATPRAERLKPDFSAKVLGLVTGGSALVATQGISHMGEALNMGESATQFSVAGLGILAARSGFKAAEQAAPELMTKGYRGLRKGLEGMEQVPELVVPFTREGIKQMRDDEQRPMPRRNPGSVPNIPEQFIRTPLPRSTEGLIKNKQFVLGKVAQMAPDMFEAVQDVFNNNPENIGQLAQVLAMKMPHFFEKDKYNRFDGRILNESDKQKAIKDTLLNNDLDSIASAKIITRLNKEGLFEG